MAMLRRIIGVTFRPKAEWDAIAEEETSIDALLRNYILPLALLAPIATMIGMKTFDRAWDPVHGYLVPDGRILAVGVATFFSIVVSIFALAAIFALIAPMYGSARNYLAALKVATYGAIPALLAGATLLVPVMVMVGMAGLFHTLVLYWLGARRVLNVPTESGAEFVAISMLFLAVLSALVGAAASVIGLI